MVHFESTYLVNYAILSNLERCYKNDIFIIIVIVLAVNRPLEMIKPVTHHSSFHNPCALEYPCGVCLKNKITQYDYQY